MTVEEVKELYAEEVSLLKVLHKYCEEQPQENLDRIEKVTLLLLHRVLANLYSASILTLYALRKNKMPFFQLPIGIILRCTFTDCLFALYIQRSDKERALEELDIRTIEYANSLLERREVYRDQVKSTGMGFDDGFIDHLWELAMEDNFLNLLTLDMKNGNMEVSKQSKSQLQESGFSKSKSVGIKEQKDFLITQEGLADVTTRLYHYYKYFSQYEHFSENGQGDVLVSSEDGNDNIHFPSAIRTLRAAVEEVRGKMEEVRGKKEEGRCKREEVGLTKTKTITKS